jgi:hypothetical protein
MNKSFLSHYLFSILFFLLAYQQYHLQLSYKPMRTRYPAYLSARLNSLFNQSCAQVPQFQSLKGLWSSYFFGKKRQLLPYQKDYHQAFFLQHLLTPSGQHLHVLQYMLAPILYIPSMGPLLYFVLSCLLCLLIALNPLDLALKRMAYFKLTILFLSLFPSLKKKIFSHFYHLFFAVFVMDFFYGTYSSSPLSFAYSFLFLGILILLRSASSSSYIFHLTLSLLLTLTFQSNSSIQILAIIPHFLFTYIAEFVFLGLLISFLFSSCWPGFFLLFSFDRLTYQFFLFLKWCPSISANAFWLIITITSLATKIKYAHHSPLRRMFNFIFIISLIFCSDPIHNNEDHVLKNNFSFTKFSKGSSQISVIHDRKI